jgi:hypothetical protein
MKQIIKLLFCSPFLLGCNSGSENYLIKTNYSTEASILVEYDIKNIEADSLSLPYYAKNDILNTIEDELLIGYNNVLHAIDFFNLSKNKFQKRIYLEDDGPNSVNRVYELNVISEDSILIIDALKLKLINSKGILINQFNLNVEEYGGYFLNYNDAELIHLPDENSVLLHFLNHNIRENEFDETMAYSIVGKLNLESGTINFLPITYSKFIYDNKGGVDELMPNLSYNNGKIIYGFPVESNIYTYELQTKKTEAFGGSSKYSSNLEDLKRSENEEFRLTGTWFNRLVFDSKNQLYLRTHWGSQPFYSNDMTENSASTKPGYVMIFDIDFNVIEEIKIPNEYWLEDSFLFSNGLGFWIKDTFVEDERILKIGVLKLKTNE